MQYRYSGSPPSGDSVEQQVAIACAETIAIVHDAVRTLQTVALDIQDAVVALQRLQDQIKGEPLQPAALASLQSALIHGASLVEAFEALGLYQPVSIDML